MAGAANAILASPGWAFFPPRAYLYELLIMVWDGVYSGDVQGPNARPIWRRDG